MGVPAIMMLQLVKSSASKILAGFLLVVSTVISAEPLGIRNHNPGNLIKSGITWKGEVACTSRFECFENAEAGLRALALNLLTSYFKHNLRTPEQILERWSPPHENETNLLVERFEQVHNFKSNEDVDFFNYTKFKSFIIGLIIQENGYNPYTYEIDNALSAITSYEIQEYWNNDTIRIADNDRISDIRGNVKITIKETGDSSFESTCSNSEGGGRAGGIPESKGNLNTTQRVDKESDSSYGNIFSNTVAKVSSIIYGYHSRCRVDRNDFWFPILYGWYRDTEMVFSKRVGYHTA